MNMRGLLRQAGQSVKVQPDHPMISSSSLLSIVGISTKNRSQNNKVTPNTLYHHIVKRDWATVQELLNSESLRKELVAADDVENPSEPEISSRILLHLICRYKPPTSIVKATVQAFPSSVSTTDKRGRMPLHIASAYAATPDVIRYLVGEYPVAAGTPDLKGKTPLHFTCECYPRRTTYKDHKAGIRPEMVEVVKILCDASPSTVNREDETGRNALEYALESHTDSQVIRSIQRACEKDWKTHKSDGLKHEELERSLQKQYLERRAAISHKRIAQIKAAAGHLTKSNSRTAVSA